MRPWDRAIFGGARRHSDKIRRGADRGVGTGALDEDVGFEGLQSGDLGKRRRPVVSVLRV